MLNYKYNDKTEKLEIEGYEFVKIKEGSTDNDGVLKSSNKSVEDLATTEVTNALDERITELEGAVEDVGQRLQDING